MGQVETGNQSGQIEKAADKVLHLESPALSFEDVLLYPQYSDVPSRYAEGPKGVNIQSKLADGVLLNIPIISAGMDTVTEEKMAIAMALEGGMGEIHRNNTIEEQAEMVRIVKDKMRVIEDKPPLLPSTATISMAMELQQKRQRGYAIVYEGPEFTGEIVGIVTAKDLMVGSPDMPVSQVMTSLLVDQYGRKLITAPEGTSLEEAVKIMKTNRIEKLPVINSERKLLGVYTLTDNKYISNHPNAAVDKHGRLLVGAAIGIRKMDIPRAMSLIEAGVDAIFIDIAHGDSEGLIKMLDQLKKKENVKVPIAAGNTATPEGVLRFVDHGADIVKVGIGPGSVCTTRNIAGTGVPQITALLEIREAISKMSSGAPTVISDGGIREPGDFDKAIGAGADAVMMGGAFAGTAESPGKPRLKDKGLVKTVRGMASEQVREELHKLSGTKNEVNKPAPPAEGRVSESPFIGSVSDVIYQFTGGLRSAISYQGAHTIDEFHKKVKFIRVTQSGANENKR
jgi:IMP dehydrogenase